MTTITVQAVYHGGILEPTTHLDLPDGATVEVQITSSASPARPMAFGSLSGVWSHLAEAEAERLGHGLAEVRQQIVEKIERLAQESTATS